jgi:hypothetical protein
VPYPGFGERTVHLVEAEHFATITHRVEECPLGCTAIASKIEDVVNRRRTDKGDHGLVKAGRVPLLAAEHLTYLKGPEFGTRSFWVR